MMGEVGAPVFAAIAGAIYLALAALHAYWARGGVWPGTDPDSLNRMVVGGPPVMRGPGPALTWVVTAILIGAATIVLARAGIIALPVPHGWIRAAGLVGASVLVLRGLEGFVDTRLRPDTKDSPFARLNVRLYSPLCLVLAFATAMAVS